MTFWERVRSFANKRVRDAYRAKWHTDFKCPHCRLWTSEVGRPVHYQNEAVTESPNGYIYACRQCGQWSRWWCFGGFWFLASNQTIDLQRVKES